MILAGGNVVDLPTYAEDTSKIARIRAAIMLATKALLIGFPNPTGAVMDLGGML